MKKLVLLAIMLACTVPLSAQNWTTVTATNITDLNQQKLAAGQLCFLGTDQNDVPISFNVGGGGQVLKRAFCSAVTNGIAASFTVPNPAGTTPTGIYYRITVKDANSAQEVLRYNQVSFTGTSFNFDGYAPIIPGQFAPLTGTAVTGNLSVNGNLSITGTFTGSSFGLLGVQGLGINGATANANAVNGPSGWTIQSAGTNELTVNSTGVTINNPSFTGSLTLPATGTATSGSNFGSITESWNASYWNGTSAASDSWTAQSFLAAGTNPNSFLIFNHSGSPGSFFQVNSALQMPATTAATSGSNVNSPTLSLLGNYWTGSASNPDVWGMQDILGAGTNPTSTLMLSHPGGSPGATTVDVSSAGTLKTGSINAAANMITAATFKSNSANAAASGQIELAANDAIKFRNNANSADVNALSKNASDVVQIGGGPGVALSGSTSGTTALVAAASASGTLTLPAATDTLVGKATTDTLTNKTIGAGGLAGLTINIQQFTSSGTFTIPAGITAVKVTVVGGGGAGGGGGSSASSAGCGGNSGGTSIKWLSGLTPGNTLVVTIGAGGAGNSNAGGGSGGNSTVASGTQTISTITGSGGAGGTGPGGVGTNATAGSGGDLNFAGNAGTLAPISSAIAGNGGGSIFGGGGLGGFATANGNAGTAPGAGGGGGGANNGVNTTGGAGVAGMVIFEWVK